MGRTKDASYWKHKKWNARWMLTQSRLLLNSYHISVPQDTDVDAIVEKLKTLPGYLMPIIDETFDGYDIYFRCTLPFKECFGELKVLLNIPDKCAPRVKRKKVRRVSQYSMDGVLLKKWRTIIDAADELRINYASISKCCNGLISSYAGFLWKYDE